MNNQKILEKIGEMPKHKIAEALIVLNGKRLSLSDYELFHPLYNVKTPKVMFKTGRQVGKSTTLAIIIALNSVLIKNYKTIYCTPLEIQVNRFSGLYVRSIISNSPMLRNMIDKDSLHSVKIKAFTNGSVIQFTYTSGGADRARGIPADEVDWDEIQDTSVDVIPVIEQCLSASKYGVQRYCGTPKTLDNTVEVLWESSSQNEWLMKCSHCNRDNFIIMPEAIKMIGKDGLVCAYCLKPIDPVADGIQWVTMNLSRENVFAGYHIPQLVIPTNLTEKRWKAVYEQFLYYPRAKFVNEVLGLSYDIGGKLMTSTELNKLKQLSPGDIPKGKNLRAKYSYIVGGIDWGISAQSSFTVLIILGLTPAGIYHVLHFEKFYSTDIVDDQIPSIIASLRGFKTDMCGCDFGVGFTNNQLLRKGWSVDKIAEYQYGNPKALVSYNKVASRYIINRTDTLNIMYVKLKKQQVLFPKTDEVNATIFPDLLALVEEIQESSHGSRKIFKRVGNSDDFAHAINFAVITGETISGRSQVNYKEDSNF